MPTASKPSSKSVVARRQSQALSTALDPSAQQLYNTCVALSKSSAIPMAYINKPDWIFSTVVMGKEFGLGPMSALTNISTINGKPSMSVHLLLGLCMRHPQFAGWRVVESDKESCLVEMFRKWPNQDKPFKYEGRFSRDEAREAGLIKPNGAWATWGRNMCKARAIAFVCREAFADVLTGTYTLEEMDSERYVDSFMAQDMQAVDMLEESELTGKPPKNENEERVPVKGTVQPPKKLAPNRK